MDTRRRPGRVGVGRQPHLRRDPVERALLGVVAVGLAILVAIPLLRLAQAGLADDGQIAADLLTGRVSGPLLREPLVRTLGLGLASAVLSTVLGAGLAWLAVLTEVPFRRWIVALAALPFVLPSFAHALAWKTVFTNSLAGGRGGLLQGAGVTVPDWLAWGWVPITLVETANGSALVFLLASAAFASIDREQQEAGLLTGASPLAVARRITLPAAAPTLVGAGLLAFAEAVSSFTGPAVLGMPVGFHTLSTRIFGTINTGQTERGFALALALVITAATVLVVARRMTRRSDAVATITGRGRQSSRAIRLGRARWPLGIGALVTVTSTTIVPLGVLALTTFARRASDPFGVGFTTHWWIGSSDPAIAAGIPGILRSSAVIAAIRNSLLLGLTTAALGVAAGLTIGYLTARRRGPVTTAVSALSYAPYFVPGIALGAVYISMFATSWGPVPSLYGTPALLVIAGLVATLPFATQAGRGAVAAVGQPLEEAASLAGAGLARRLGRIVAPLTYRPLLAGAMLIFVKMVRDLDLVVLLVTPATDLLSIVTYRYASDGRIQLANAASLLMAALSIAVFVAVRRLQGTAPRQRSTARADAVPTNDKDPVCVS